MLKNVIGAAALATAVLLSPGGFAGEAALRMAAGPAVGQQAGAGSQSAPEQVTPEQRMQRRYPHPVRVGDLVGLSVLDEYDSTIGYVRDVVRSPEGKIFLIVPYSSAFGWVRTQWGKRPVAVPIELVTILARQIDAEDMSRADFDRAPTWTEGKDIRLPLEDNTLIALGRR